MNVHTGRCERFQDGVQATWMVGCLDRDDVAAPCGITVCGEDLLRFVGVVRNQAYDAAFRGFRERYGADVDAVLAEYVADMR